MVNGPAAASLAKMRVVKRQNDPRFDTKDPPMPQGDHFGHDKYIPRWAMILMGVLLGVLLLITIVYAVITILRRRKTKTSTSDIKKAIHQRSMSGISDDDPDNIKPVKRLRSFHMKGAKVMSPDTMSPRTPKEGSSLFGRFFRKKEGGRMPPLDEEKNDSYASLNSYPDTPGLDEKMLEASPPPTPAPAFGWASSAGGMPGQNKRRSASDGVGEQNTAYKGDARPPAGQGERDSFLSASSGGDRDPSKRLSTEYNENYQSKPSSGYSDDDDDERKPLGYNPDSRSGH
ncbi:hypothetical protein ABW19_dt0208892 [Dactylella cylindrospora]|nr:hypothetical protein ABW19_dt0208892 [Dactylella cylindrospora]